MVSEKNKFYITKIFYFTCILAILVANFFLYTHLKYMDRSMVSLVLQVFLTVSLCGMLYSNITSLNKNKVILCSMLSGFIFLISGIIGTCFTMDFTNEFHNFVTITGVYGFIHLIFGMTIAMVGIPLLEGFHNTSQKNIGCIIFACMLVLIQRVALAFMDYGYPSYLFYGIIMIFCILLIQLLGSYFIQYFFSDIKFSLKVVLNLIFVLFIVSTELDIICFGTTQVRDTGWAISYIFSELFKYISFHCIIAILAVVTIAIFTKTALYISNK